MAEPVEGMWHHGRVADHYDIGHDIGSGTYATVKLCTKKGTGETFAVKVIDKSQAEFDADDIKKEVAAMRKLRHPNVLALHEVYEERDRFCLVMDYAAGGELFDRIIRSGTYTERVAANCIAQVCEALDYTHGAGVVHRDLKPENILYATEDDDAPVLIADFGFAKVMNEKANMQTACGTPGYVAPEILDNQGYGPQVDLWSVGVVLYILLCGFPPFYDKNVAKLLQNVMKAKYDFPSPWWDNVSPEAKDLVQALLQRDPAKRLTAAEVLRHPWIHDATHASLEDAAESLKEYNVSRRKLKKVALGVMFQRRIVNALQSSD